jgi:O-antigen/teichoic acid export membrane protein
VALFWVLAPLLSVAFGGDARVTLLLRILAGGFLLNGLKNLHVLRYQHQLRFGLVLLLDGAGTVAAALTSIALLLLGGDALALAIGTTAGAAATTW